MKKANTNSFAKKAFIVGAFEFKNMSTGGQPVKTRELLKCLQAKYGVINVSFLDTAGWKEKPIKLFFSFLYYAKRATNIIMLPAQNGLIVFALLLVFAKKIWRKHIFYDVIGGWLPDLVAKKAKLKTRLKEFDGIWVETNVMKNNLLRMGFTNVSILNNFKAITVDKSEIINKTNHFSVCTFSRVMFEKGIEDAISVVERINKETNYSVSLHIFGQIDKNYEKQFMSVIAKSDYAVYKGVVDTLASVETLKSYYLLLFPTHFATEGIPGTIIDAYFAGVPVISARWNSFSDVIDENETGIGFHLLDNEEFFEALLFCIRNPLVVEEMRQKCKDKSFFYSAEYNSNIIDSLLC